MDIKLQGQGGGRSRQQGRVRGSKQQRATWIGAGMGRKKQAAGKREEEAAGSTSSSSSVADGWSGSED